MNIKPHLFLRTYKGDRDWLPYLFRSIAKHAPDVGITVVAPKGHDVGVAVDFAVNPVHGDGYVDQQYSKLMADTMVPKDTTHVVHIDSDCLLISGLDKLFTEGKPNLVHAPWDQVGDAKCWKGITDELLGFEAPFEFMRRMPLAYPIGAYARLRAHLAQKHGFPLSRIMGDIPGRHVSEFNLLGSFCWREHHDEFNWIEYPREPLPHLVAMQGWSWGGVEKARDEWEALLA